MARWAAFLVPALLAVVLALPARTGGWIRDDAVYVVNNPQVVGGRPLLEAFLTPFAPSSGDLLGLYRPMTTVSLALDARRGGETPTAFHETNLLLAALLAATFAGLLMTLGLHPGLAAAAATLYAVHPVRTEAVNWISGRSELLMAWFSLLALWVGSRPGFARASLAALLVVAATFAKEQGAVVLFLLPLLPGLPLAARRLHLMVTGVALAAALSFRLHVLGTIGPEGAMQVLGGVSLWERFLFGLQFLADYASKVVAPMPLINEYDDPTIPVSSARILLGGMVLLASLFAVWAAWSREESDRLRARGAFGYLLFFIPLVPVLNIVYRTGETFAERFMTLPMAGAALLFGICMERLWKSPTRAALLLFGCALPFIVLSYRRSDEWQSVDTLFESQIRSAPQVGGGYQVLAAALLEREGGAESAPGSFDRVADLLQKAVERSPARVQSALAYARFNLRRASTEPDPAVKEVRLGDAEKFFRLTIEQDPSISTARGGLALTFALRGMDTAAENTWKEELRVHPHEFRSALNYANFLRDRSRAADAQAVLESARAAVTSDLAGNGRTALARGTVARNEALRVAAEIDVSRGDLKGAIAMLEEAVREAPDPETRVRTVLELARRLESDQGREASLRAIERVRNGLRDTLESGAQDSARPGLLMALADAEAALGDNDEARKALEAARPLACGLRKSKIERALAGLAEARRDR